MEYKDIYIFSSGVVLTLPEIPQNFNSLLPPWKRKGAAG